MPRQTPSQTVGPFLKMGLIRGVQNKLVSEATEGERIRIEGRVLDGEGQPINDAMLEIWQANAHGRYDHPDDTQDKPLDPAFTGFGRAATEEDGAYWFETVKPGSVPGPGNALQAPHINITLFARGMLLHAITRLYFPDEPTNEADPILNAVDDENRRGTLIADGGPAVYRFDIRVQGEGETVFFDT